MTRLLLVTVFFLTLLASAQAAVPTPDEFLGYSAGQRLTPPARIDDYFAALAKSSPRITLTQYGESYEGRPLIYAVITSEKNRSRLDDIQRKLTSVASSPQAADAKAFAADLPAVVWLGFGVHGDEVSSGEAAMRVAHDLVADESSALLDSLVVIIDPAQNPDGRSLYVENVTQALGSRPNPNREALEHSSDWRAGRGNHYLVDLNRDWAWGTQKETRARVAAYFQWMPQVFVDFHEMGAHGGEYFFPPVANPVNANVDPEAPHFYELFGRGNAKAFEAKNWPFFVGEIFDLFYPSYGDSWPTLHGAIGMTYEVAGKGVALALKREDGTMFTLADRIDRHYTAAMATLRTAADNRQALLAHTFNALAKPPGDATTFFIPRAAGKERSALSILKYNGIEVRQLARPVTMRAERVLGGAPAKQFDAGTLIVTTRQPFGGIARTLLERSPAIAESFINSERVKVQADESDDFYDITAWSLPASLNVDTYFVKGVPDLPLQPVAESAAQAFRSGQFGYLIDALDPSVYSAAGEFFRRGIHFSVASQDLGANGGAVRRGSLVIRRGNNDALLDKQLEEIAGATGAVMQPVAGPWSGGASLGSPTIVPVREPNIGIVAGHGVDVSSFGGLWHTLDLAAGLPHTVLPVERLDRMDLHQYRVLIFPDGDGYDDAVSSDGVKALEQWVRSGGTIVAIKSASDFFRSKDVALSKIRMATDPPKKEKKDEAEPDEQPLRRNEVRVPGAAFRTTFRERSYLTFGIDRAPSVVMEGSDAILPLPRETDNVVTITREDPLAAGFAWPESIERLRGSVWLASESLGKGSVITFADEPFFREFWRGTYPIFCNAVLYSPTFNDQN